MLRRPLACVALAGAAFAILKTANAAAPVITANPSAQTVAPGASAFFSANATGTPPLRYVWRRDSQFLPGATNSLLVLSNVQLSDVGNYSVRVSNSDGVAFSSSAPLAVLDSYALDLPQGFSLIANQLEGSNNNTLNAIIPLTPDGTTLFKFNNAAQAFEPVDTYFIGVGWINPLGEPSTTRLNPGEGAFINLPAPFTLVFNGGFRPALLPVSLAPGFNLLSRQNPREARYDEIVGQAPPEGTIMDQFDPLLQDYRAHTFFQGRWRDGVPVAKVGEAVWISQVVLPTIFQQPTSRTNAGIGDDVTFLVGASGNAPLRYQWRRNGVNIPGATNDFYTIGTAQKTDAGIYTVAVQAGRIAPSIGAQGGKLENVIGAAVSVPVALKFAGVDFPFSDFFAAQSTVSAFSGALSGNNSAASAESGEPNHAGKPGGHSVWVSWTAPATGIVTFHTLGSAFDTLLAVYPGVSFVSQIAGDDDGGPFFSSRVAFNATAGQRYNIAVDGFAGASGDFILTWNLEQTTERLPVITTQPKDQIVDLGSSASFSAVPAFSTNSVAPQWFMDGTPISGAIQSNYVIAAVKESDVGVYSVRFTSGGRSVMSQGAQLQIRPAAASPDGAKAGGTDPVALDKFQDVVAAATNSVPDAVPSKARRKTLAHGFSGTQIFSTLGSTKEPGEPNHAGIVGGKSEWFAYQPTNSGTLKVDTDGSNFDTVLAVYVGPGDTFATLTNVASDNNSGTNGLTSSVLFEAVSNTVYWIAVDGVNNVNTGIAASGNVHLNYRLVLPLTLTSIGYSPSNNGRVIFKVTGTPNVAATVQAATNLVSPTWTSLFTNATANGVFNYTNTNALTATNRVFRVLNRL